jgi:hydrogenase maturation protease
MDNRNERVLIVGLGNSLMGDDGVGVFVIETLENASPPANLTIVNCGSDVLKILSHLEGQQMIIIIDAVDMGQAPGTIFRFRKSEFLGLKGDSKSAHLLSAVDSLRLLETINPDFQKADLEFIGIQAQIIERRPQLVPPVRKAAEQVISEILESYF